jgi:hypothetical protein
MSPDIEAELTRKLRWPSVPAIPEFPAVDFRQLGEREKAGDLALIVDSMAAIDAAHRLFGKGHSIVSGLLGWVPYFVAVSAIPAAVLLKRFSALSALPIALIALLAANQASPFRRLGTMFAWVAAVAALAFTARGELLPACLWGSYAVPFWSTRLLIVWNVATLRKAALRSESLFLFLFQNRRICVVQPSTGAKFLAPVDEGEA